MKGSVELWIVLALVAGVALTLGAQRLYAAGGFVHNTVDTYLHPPWSATKVLAAIAALIMVPALAIGLLEWRADRRFRREAKAIRAAWLTVDEVEYEGPEGSGLLFIATEGRRLLLRPAGGLGAPRVIELPPTATPDGQDPQPS